MTISLLTNVTTTTIGASSGPLTPSPVEGFVVTATGTGPISATVLLQTSPDNVNWTTQVTIVIVAINYFTQTANFDVPTSYYVRAWATNITPGITINCTYQEASFPAVIGTQVSYVDTNGLVYKASASYIIGQSSLPVMIAQSGYISSASGAITPGPNTPAATVVLSATSGSVSVTLGSAILAGTSADNGKQITFYDSTSSIWRSLLITAFGTTLTCTATLSSTASGLGPFSTTTALGSPLPVNYTNGVWVYLPTGATALGSAGYYWCTPYETSSVNGMLQLTTAYQATMGIPTIPTGFSNALGSGANFTQVTSTNITLASVTIPGNSMGANGMLRASGLLTGDGAATTTRFITQNFGSLVVATGNYLITAALSGRIFQEIRNRGVTNGQITHHSTTTPAALGAALAVTQGTVDTTVSQTYSVQGSLTTATDFIVLEALTVEALYHA